MFDVRSFNRGGRHVRLHRTAPPRFDVPRTRSWRPMSFDDLPDLPSYCLADMAWPDIQRFVEADGICLVPFGSQESHGPAVPVGCDTYHCVETVERAAPAARVPYT